MKWITIGIILAGSDMPRFSYLILIGTLIIYFAAPFPFTGEVLGATSVPAEDILAFVPEIETETAFDQKETEEYVSIAFETRYEDDSAMEYGLEEVLQEGENGTRTLTYLVTFWGEDIIDKKLLDTQIVNPVEEIIAKGTKIVWRMYSTPDVGRVKYWHKLHVWATKYDANCIGCTGRTYSGTEVKKGVCAVDPRLIPLGTNFYVDGYGLCRAEDIGGAIKGNKIDLGYKDVTKGEWRTGWTTIYLLTNAPE